MQKSRFDDQRCDLKTSSTNAVAAGTASAPSPHHRSFPFLFSTRLCFISARYGFSGTSAQLEDILNTVDRLQKTRLNDQRTTLPSAATATAAGSNANQSDRLTPLNEQFFDQLAKCQVSFVVFSRSNVELGFVKDSRLDDQRAVLIPIHNHRPVVSPAKAASVDIPSKTLPDDDFFSLLNRLQSRRIDQQRTCLPPTSPSKRTRANP